MGWLWNLGGRYAAQKLWQQVTASASTQRTPEGDSDPQPEGREQSRTACRLVVICWSDRLFSAFSDAMPWKQQTHADGFRVQRGKLAGSPIVIACPTRLPVETQRIVSALVDTHTPRFIVSASEGTSATEQIPMGAIVVADRVVGPQRTWMLDAKVPPREGLFTGAVAASPELSENALAIAPFSCEVASVCVAKQIPLMAATAIVQPHASEQSREVAMLENQRSLAGRAGVVTGMMWKRREGLKQLWRQKQATWRACERLVALVNRIASAD